MDSAFSFGKGGYRRETVPALQRFGETGNEGRGTGRSAWEMDAGALRGRESFGFSGLFRENDGKRAGEGASFLSFGEGEIVESLTKSGYNDIRYHRDGAPVSGGNITASRRLDAQEDT